ncbi:MAG: hypothetical protein R3D05_12815 [Dongiaceae bacterium]
MDRDIDRILPAMQFDRRFVVGAVLGTQARSHAAAQIACDPMISVGDRTHDISRPRHVSSVAPTKPNESFERDEFGIRRKQGFVMSEIEELLPFPGPFLLVAFGVGYTVKRRMQIATAMGLGELQD